MFGLFILLPDNSNVLILVIPRNIGTCNISLFLINNDCKFPNRMNVSGTVSNLLLSKFMVRISVVYITSKCVNEFFWSWRSDNLYECGNYCILTNLLFDIFKSIILYNVDMPDIVDILF